MLFAHTGKLNYSRDGSAFRLTVEVDRQLGDYYFSLAPRYWKLVPSKFPPHVTVTRIHKEIPKNLSLWGKHQGRQISFYYEPGLHKSKTYCWLRVVSKELEEIRRELGLEVARSTDPTHASYAIPPEGFIKYFHLTIGNFKG